MGREVGGMKFRVADTLGKDADQNTVCLKEAGNGR